ncbi:MAG: cell division protein ZapA [Rhodobacteraceae bacterium]|nr:cell division protein ZapA [Paracoccaceae bacterium]
MPEVRISIGGRDFDVACQEGEEHFLQSAAKMLDAEASVLQDQIGRMPEARMLLMAGLMLADKTAGVEDQNKQLQDKIAGQEAWIEALQNAPTPEAAPAPGPVAVPDPVEDLTPALEALATEAEALAARVEEKAAS